MNARDRFEAAAELFLEADKLPQEKIEEFLQAKCGADDELRAQVRALLAGRDAPDVFDALASRLKPLGGELRENIPAEHDGARLPNDNRVHHRLPEEASGDMIGRFRLAELIGEGGFGRVWAAEQIEPVRRRVAIKILKAGMDSREVLTRFEAERQALAFMDHPNIAKVLDAGVTDRARPYFVMEYVPGSSITTYCDANQLRVRERLELFVDVCRALHHAHQRGIIHRDLKPSNILVSLVDGRPAPKIIDFGIAKATKTPLTDRTLATMQNGLLGTPEYMSPEQAASGGGGADIDTRSDIYSLGVVLYQLLTGTLPFDSKVLLGAGYEGMLRLIREQDPPKPSTRCATLMTDSLGRRNAALTDAARSEKADSRTTWRELRGELDWLVMKCLEKDRERRYESADALRGDIQRYLNDEPIIAAPPSRTYQLKKLVRRNGLLIGAASSVMLALLAGLGVSLYLYAEEREARLRAIAAESESKLRAVNLQRVADFQSEMLGQVDPTVAGLQLSEDVTAKFHAALVKAGSSPDQLEAQAAAFSGQWGLVNATDTAREFIDRTILRPAVQAIDKRFVDQPEVAATLRSALAERYNELGMFETAVSLESQVLDVRRRALGDDHQDTLTSMDNMARFLQAQRKLDEAIRYCTEAMERSQRVLGEDAPLTITCAARMGSLLNAQGKRAEAEPFYLNALDKRRHTLGDTHPETLTAISNMGSLRRDQGKLAEAEPFFVEAMEKRRQVLGEEHRDTLISINNMASLLKDMGKTEQAAASFREVVEKRRRVLGETHPSTLSAIRNLGAVLAARGEVHEAESLLREALSSQQRQLGADHPSTIGTLSNLGVFLMEHGDAALAEPMCREALARRQRVLGMNHPDTLISNNVMAFVLRRQNKPAEAEPYVRETLDIGRRVLGSSHPDTLIYAHNLGALRMELNKPADAEPLFREVIEKGGPVLGREHQLVLSATSYLGAVLIDQKRPDEAAAMLANSEAAARAALKGPSERTLGMFLMNLGMARVATSQFASGEPTLLDAHAILARARGATQRDIHACAQALANLYSAWDAVEPNAERRARAAEWSEKLKAPDSPVTESGAAPQR